VSPVNTADLSRVALFAGLSEASLQIIAGWLEVNDVPAGWALTHEGASGYAFSILHSGTANVTVHGNVVRTLGPGDFFGEISILGDGRQTATITVTSPAEVWTMFGTRFRELQQHHPDIADAIARTAAARLAR
jgi:CRP/FNR family cyclic AMP-dependent transcriptional regulator